MRPFCALLCYLFMIFLEFSNGSGKCGEEVLNDGLDDWNFLVALFQKNTYEYYPFDYEYFCAGTILNSWQILTAAHCTFEPNKSTLAVVQDLNHTGMLVGEPDTWAPKGYKVQHIVYHEDYDNFTHVNDIAILTLAEPLNLPTSWFIDLEPFNYHPESKPLYEFVFEIWF